MTLLNPEPSEKAIALYRGDYEGGHPFRASTAWGGVCPDELHAIGGPRGLTPLITRLHGAVRGSNFGGSLSRDHRKMSSGALPGLTRRWRLLAPRILPPDDISSRRAAPWRRCQTRCVFRAQTPLDPCTRLTMREARDAMCARSMSVGRSSPACDLPTRLGA
jgi:hypothetical protein